MRAEIERNSATAIDGYGQLVKAAWASLAVVPCHVWSSRRSKVDDNNKVVMIEVIIGMFPKNADVTEEDRIVSVKNRLGDVLFSGPLSIGTLSRRSRHKEAVLGKLS